MTNKEIYKIFDKAFSAQQEKTRLELNRLWAGHPESNKLARLVMQEMIVRATIEKLLGYERNDSGTRIIKRVRKPNPETDLILAAGEGDVNAAEKLLKSWTKNI